MTLVPPYPGSGWSGAEGPGRKIWGGSGGVAPDCSSVAAAALQTGTFPPVASFGPWTIGPPGAPAVAPSTQILVFAVNEGTGFVGSAPESPVPIGGGWTSLDRWEVLATHTWVEVAYLHQLAVAVPPAMTAGPIAGSGGAPMGFGVAGSFGTTGAAPVQVGTPIGTGGTVTLPGAPTPGNLLVAWIVGETAAVTVDGTFTWPINNQHFTGGSIGIGGLWVSLGFRCAVVGDGAVINVGNGPFTHYMSVSEWVVP
jgi:hypothetical protein